jgi:hypothetical protein
MLNLLALVSITFRPIFSSFCCSVAEDSGLVGCDLRKAEKLVASHTGRMKSSAFVFSLMNRL